MGRALTLDRLLWNLARITKSALLQGKLAAISRRVNFSKIGLRTNIHDTQRVYLRKLPIGCDSPAYESPEAIAGSLTPSAPVSMRPAKRRSKSPDGDPETEATVKSYQP